MGGTTGWLRLVLRVAPLLDEGHAGASATRSKLLSANCHDSVASPRGYDQSFGMRIVLIIKLPETANISTSGCKCQGPTIAEPPITGRQGGPPRRR